MFRSFTLMLAGLLLSISFLAAQSWYAGYGVYQLNGIHFKLDPKVTLRSPGSAAYDLSLSSSSQTYADSVIINYTHPSLNVKVKLSVIPDRFHVPTKRVEVFSEYFDTVFIQDFALKLNFTQQQPKYALRGPDAINYHDISQNINLYPYTDRAMELVFDDASLWLVGSNYYGCANLDWIEEDRVHLYDNALHFARRYNPDTRHFDTLNDTMKRHPGDSNYYSFLIFEEKPVLLKIKRWPASKDAALVITNDADGESPARMRAVYFGSSDVNSPKYLNEGIIANNLKVTNTVFGASKPVLASLWQELQDHGITIGYHTYGAHADLGDITYQNLVNEMTEFNIRTWIDHSWALNPEDICVEGWNPESEYYILDAINDSTVDYIWLGDAPYTNPMNSFTEPWRLPHKLYEFDGLNDSAWFYGRTLMGTWEALSNQYLTDMKHQLTTANLDQLLREGGLCVVYTHFFFAETEARIAFYQTHANGSLEIRDEVNDRLQMLDYYQTYRGLWIDTLEEVFDRMLATEKLTVETTAYAEAKGDDLIQIHLNNGSDMRINDLSIRYKEQETNLDYLTAGTPLVFSIGQVSILHPDFQFLKIVPMYDDGFVSLKHVSGEPLPELNVDIYNIRGQKVMSQHIEKNAVSPSIPFFKHTSGVYIARISTPSGFSKNFKFTVVK